MLIFIFLFYFICICIFFFFFFSSRRRHTRSLCDWSSDVCSSDLLRPDQAPVLRAVERSVAPDATLVWVGGTDSWDYPFFGERLSRRVVRVPGGDAPQDGKGMCPGCANGSVGQPPPPWWCSTRRARRRHRRRPFERPSRLQATSSRRRARSAPLVRESPRRMDPEGRRGRPWRDRDTSP